MISIKPVSRNAPLSIRDTLDPHSNLIEESNPQLERQLQFKTSTDEGRMISTKPVLVNAQFPIRDNLDPDSNVIEESALHSAKHPSLNTYTDA
jgi:hypothetical protein